MDSKIFAVAMGTGLSISAGVLVYWTSGGHFGSAIGAAIPMGIACIACIACAVGFGLREHKYE